MLKNMEINVALYILANNLVLEYSCNKYCDLIGHSEVSISHRDLQVLIETYKFHRDLQV